jgi:NADH-quinone oxidoreductase subunit L
MFPLFVEYAPDILHLIAYAGAFTALYAAIVACAQTDIKRVLAFSTISQIAFMMVSLGVCTSTDPHEGGLGYMASMFHLLTHAMFKGLLFLGAGAIIHAVHSNEKEKMGGLWRYMPITHITFLIACLAIAGIPPFSGFFSKDEILAACYGYSLPMGIFMSGVAALTAFYMFRLYYLIFWGKSHYRMQMELYEAGELDHKPHKPHEAPPTMTLPLIILAAITCVAGFIPFGEFISSDGQAYTIHIDMGIASVSVLLAIAGIAVATIMYSRGNSRVTRLANIALSGPIKAAKHRFYIDEVWIFFTKNIIFNCISRPIAWFDRHVIDGSLDFTAKVAQKCAALIRPLQSGNVQTYCIYFLSGALAIMLLLLYLNN